MHSSLAVVHDTAKLRKARGAFFTPEPVASFVTTWALRDATDTVLEPSCGEAAFLEHAVTRLRELSGDPALVPVVDGVEIHGPSAQEAERIVTASGGEANVIVSDFFLVEPSAKYAAVIGNPPYIRYQDFVGEARLRSRTAALQAGVNISGLASSWAAFTVHSALMLRKSGRMGLVVPAELLSVNYAAEVRRFLLSRFKRIDLVLFTERVFAETQEDVILLLADGYDEGHADHMSIYQAQNAAALNETMAATTWKPTNPSDKWTPSLLSSDALGAYNALLEESFTPLETWGETTLGMVTGNNRYFALSPARVKELGISSKDLIRLSPPGSSHLRGLTFTENAWRTLGKCGSATYLFRPKGEPDDAAAAYVEAGEVAGVDQAYKCRVRKPWWRVPLVKPADLFLTYMNADTPRITTNAVGALHLNSVHGIYLKSEHRDLGRASLPLAALTSMTLVGAETVGRSYGGGMLKLEPREADRLPVPAPAVVAAASNALLALRPQLASRLRAGNLVEAAKLVDDILLVGELGIARSEVKSLRDAYAELWARRTARGRRVEI
ncbi:Eco57I restriction-modification methylase domain-containing protein [Rathayibacter toxicus]|uniref:site-specific DNA-methyltransferase (adenine-specific) n=1 Tax=Rathayibacter toxicus TaxID=145458 RepID=A0A0C5BGD1_9MICO|nr:N-6 DNA methylase [Rathayibacter toxicus]AJM78174.1 methyltransferase [Rathayibacter toxicus]ALS57554.1 methyltransferase [Rathayibacter toxicus]KKM44915.1 methyltransferase [Rathayibacter toxicus]PPG20778.1 SAM-dependent methyltransferase [Rathayibacter toxicus]PPG45881.1 SAM-dependent methyltransferase [Rathayibacter toxicus]